ncbi:MAG: ABC transporter substrate-binding protein [archaeon]
MNKMILPGIIISIIVIIAVIAVVLFSQPVSHENTYKIGVLAALTGSGSFIGEGYVAGLTQAQNEINSKGGVNGKNIDLIIEDNQNLASVGVTSFQSLVVRNPDLIISTMSSPTVAIAHIAKDISIPIFVSVVFADVLPTNQNSVSFFPTAVDDAKSSIEGMKKNGVKSVGIIFLNTEYGKASADALVSEAKTAGIEIVGNEAFDGVANDFQTPLAKIIAKKPDALYVAAINATPIIKEAKLFGPKPPIFTNLIPVFGGLIYSDKNTFEGVRLNASAVSVPGSTEQSLFANKFPQITAAGYASIGYDNLYSIKAVLEKNSDPHSFVQAFQNLRSFSGINGTYQINSRHISMNLYPVVFENGQIKSED